MNLAAVLEEASAQHGGVIVEINYYLAFLCGMILNTLIIVLIHFADVQNMRLFGIIMTIRSAINILCCIVCGALKTVCFFTTLLFSLIWKIFFSDGKFLFLQIFTLNLHEGERYIKIWRIMF